MNKCQRIDRKENRMAFSGKKETSEESLTILVHLSKQIKENRETCHPSRINTPFSIHWKMNVNYIFSSLLNKLCVR